LMALPGHLNVFWVVGGEVGAYELPSLRPFLFFFHPVSSFQALGRWVGFCSIMIHIFLFSSRNFCIRS
jgi:hypothetical protein